MNQTDKPGSFENDPAAIVFDAEENLPVSSGASLRGSDAVEPLPAIEPALADDSLSPIFKQLATPVLPELPRENRARLQMQSPNRLYFYWSLRKDPFHTLRSLFGANSGSYTLVVKLLDLTRGTEEIRPTESAGDLWFAVDPGIEYRAEIGLYAPNRPFIRVLFSNSVTTPRKKPSPRPAADSDWTITSERFARVLDVAGFSQDAFDVALAGDDWDASTSASRAAFTKFTGVPETQLDAIDPEDIRYAMLAIAAGITLEELRFRIGATLFAILQANAERLDREYALAALKEQFGIDAEDLIEEEFGPAVYGASLVNFPRRLRRVSHAAPKFAPVSS